jgi:hypothetical protein
VFVTLTAVTPKKLLKVAFIISTDVRKQIFILTQNYKTVDHKNEILIYIFYLITLHFILPK